jgi:hypothetical protein
MKMRIFMKAGYVLLVAIIVWSCDDDGGTNLKSLVLQPDASAGKDALITSANPDQTGGNAKEFYASVFTDQGPPDIVRSLIEFDLSEIPAGSEILLATVSLYYDQQSDSTHSSITGPNTALLQRITTSWEEGTVTWQNQPTSTTANQVVINASTTATQDYTEIDATDLIQDMINNRSTSFGMLFRLEAEDGIKGMYLASSDHTNPGLHPKIQIRYLK